MRSTRDRSIVIWLLCAALVAGCAGDRMNQSTEEAVDDSLLANKVKMALYADKQVRGRQMTVEASQGVIQLSGVAASPTEAQRAVQIAQGIKGVKEVRNSIALGPDTPFGQKLDDSVTTGKVKAALIDTKDVKSGNINVETRAGVVQLSGFVPSMAMRDKAGVVAGKVEGVKQIDNVLQVKPD